MAKILGAEVEEARISCDLVFMQIFRCHVIRSAKGAIFAAGEKIP
jgi:hypothetical protein